MTFKRVSNVKDGKKYLNLRDVIKIELYLEGIIITLVKKVK